jgi:hypothetical protein
MADLERLAIQRDRKFLVRLIIMLVLGAGVGLLLIGPLTGENVSGCAAKALLGAPQR